MYLQWVLGTSARYAPLVGSYKIVQMYKCTRCTVVLCIMYVCIVRRMQLRCCKIKMPEGVRKRVSGNYSTKFRHFTLTWLAPSFSHSTSHSSGTSGFKSSSSKPHYNHSGSPNLNFGSLFSTVLNCSQPSSHYLSNQPPTTNHHVRLYPYVHTVCP